MAYLTKWLTWKRFERQCRVDLKNSARISKIWLVRWPNEGAREQYPILSQHGLSINLHNTPFILLFLTFFIKGYSGMKLRADSIFAVINNFPKGTLWNVGSDSGKITYFGDVVKIQTTSSILALCEVEVYTEPYGKSVKNVACNLKFLLIFCEDRFCILIGIFSWPRLKYFDSSHIDFVRLLPKFLLL